MKTVGTIARHFEFSFPGLDTLVLVEKLGDDVVIRATRDTFSAERKARFIRELAAEGFIPDDFRWSSPEGTNATGQLRWLVDFHWLQPNKAMVRRTRHLLLGIFASAALLWSILMVLLFLGCLQSK